MMPLNYNGCPEQETHEEGFKAKLRDGVTIQGQTRV